MGTVHGHKLRTFCKGTQRAKDGFSLGSHSVRACRWARVCRCWKNNCFIKRSTVVLECIIFDVTMKTSEPNAKRSSGVLIGSPNYLRTSVKAGFHFGEFGRATKRWVIRPCAARNPSWKRAFTGTRATSSGSWIKFNFFATRMSESQSDCFFSMLEHAIIPVRATKFAEVEIGLNILLDFGTCSFS